MKKYELALIAMLFILFITTSAAQQLVWKHTGGPMGGIIGDIDCKIINTNNINKSLVAYLC